MTPTQMKAARTLLGWSRRQLGVRSGTSIHVVQKFERTGQVAKLYGRTERVEPLVAIRATLKAAGVEFTNGNELGVKLRRPDQ